ncbi:hypothetical protein FIBSPDRAFT_902743 [Athelia psychrophila]|uniref:Uncharacterized protein n=1 Tax=Athelia psychrophila TaxID=1759441 RepID=A0A167WUS1_9AGAM|nr:hypothetical protein FIBSPDRAFT_902743 [Fibularhizoctonia sp. CBS 109695]
MIQSRRDSCASLSGYAGATSVTNPLRILELVILRTAWTMHCEAKLAQWYRNNFRRDDKPGSDDKLQKTVASASPLAEVLGGKTTGAPHRKGPFAHYKKTHFNSRVKCAYDEHVLDLQAQWDSTTPDDQKANGLSNPTGIGIRTSFTSACWKAETDAFKKSVGEEAEVLHLQSVACWEVGLKAVKTPGQYHEQLHHISQHIQPIADAIAAQMDSQVFIFMVGPIPARNGEIEPRSITAGRPGCVGSVDWCKFDPMAVAAAEQSMVAFSRTVFSNAECRMRALPPGYSNQAEVGDDHSGGESEPEDGGQPDRRGHKAAASWMDTMRAMDYLHKPSADPPSAPVTAPPLVALLEPDIAVVPPVATVVSSHVAFTAPAPAASSRTASPPTPTEDPPVSPTRRNRAEQGEESPVQSGMTWPFHFPGASPPRKYGDAGMSLELEELVEDADDFDWDDGLLHKSLQDVMRDNPIPNLDKLYGPSANLTALRAQPQPRTIPATFQQPVHPRPHPLRSATPVAPLGNTASAPQPSATHVAPPPPPPPPSPPHPLQSATPVAPSGNTAPAPQPSATLVAPPPPSPPPPHPLQSATPVAPPQNPSPAPQRSASLFAPPDLTLHTPCMSLGYNWLISDTELWGRDWTDSINLFMELHQLSGFPETHRDVSFPPHINIRPQEIGKWMTSHRKWADMLISDVPAYAVTWWAWWNVLQPSEWVSPDGMTSLPPMYDMDWACLRKAGNNGLLLVVVALRWWGKASNASADWRKAAADFRQTLFWLLEKLKDRCRRPRGGRRRRVSPTRTVCRWLLV